MNTISHQLESDRSPVVARFVGALWQPSRVFLPLLIAGIVLWLCPSTDGAAGYRIREELTLISFFVLVCWYGLIILSAALGQRVALALPGVQMMADDAFDSLAFYRTLTGIACFGVVCAWIAALSGGVSLIELAKTQQFNLLKESLYSNYNHLYSLRYSASLAGGYALYRLVFLSKFGWIDTLNICMLFAAAAISARLLMAQAVVFAIGLAIRFDALKQFACERS